MSTVDVIIPCYNYARYLRGCVRSVLSQSRVAVRVLVIDDASSDDSAKVSRELAASDDRVQFRQHEVNKGHIATYNEGLLEWSTGDYNVLLSADDMLSPDALNRAVGIMDADRTVGMVYGRAIHFQQESELPRVVDARKYGYSRFAGLEWLEARCRAGCNVISSPEVVVRGSVQRAVGGYCPELPHTGDLEMWLRIAAVSSIAYIRRVPQAFYRVHPESMLRTKFVCHLKDLLQRKDAFDMFFRQHETIVQDAGRLHDLAMRALAREALWAACRAYDHNRVEEFRAEELVAFALKTYSRAGGLAEYAALGRRRRLGPVICKYTQLFAATALIRRVRHSLLRRRWRRGGEMTLKERG